MKCLKKDCLTETQLMNWSLGWMDPSHGEREKISQCIKCQNRLKNMEHVFSIRETVISERYDALLPVSELCRF